MKKFYVKLKEDGQGKFVSTIRFYSMSEKMAFTT